MSRGHYGKWIGINEPTTVTDWSISFGRPLPLPAKGPHQSVEELRKEAGEVAAHQSTFPKTRAVIVVSRFPSGWSAPSFDNVKDADNHMAFQRKAAAEARARVERDMPTYVAYFEKNTNKLLFEWDFWQHGPQDPPQWQLDPQDPPQRQSPEATLAWVKPVALGIGVLGLGYAVYSHVESRRRR